MQRTITVRSTAIDSWTRRMRAIQREKEATLGIARPLASSIQIAPTLDGGKLGFFRPDNLLIAISEDLIEDGTDSQITNVFLHELAHALDYRVNGKIGHSQSFRECCRALGVDEGFDKSAIRLSIGRMSAKRERIRKLMALSSSPFENESAIAIRKAQSLMLENGIDERTDERIYTAPLYSSHRFSYGVKAILGYTERMSGIFLITSSDGGIRNAIAYGSLPEVEFAIYLFDYLISSVESGIRAAREDGIRISRDNFIMGMIDTLSGKMPADSTETAIAAIQSLNMERAGKIVYPGMKFIRKATKSYLSFDEGSYGQGKGFADKLDIPNAMARKALE